MTHLTLPRAAIAASLGLLLALPVAATAFAGGGKPAAPPAKPAGKPAPAPASSEKYSSFADLVAAEDSAEEAAQKAMRRQRYAKVVAYLAANGKAADAEEARIAAYELAAEIEDWAKAAQHADEYLAAHANGKNVRDAQLTKAHALGKQGKKADATAAYDAVIAGMDAAKADMDTVRGNINVFSSYAEFLVDADDIPAAKAIWQKLKDFYAGAEFSGQVAQLAEGQMKPLESIGQPATPIPDTAKDLDGKPVTIEDFKGKILMIDFWATWCGPCRAEMPNVIAAYRKYHDKGFEILGVSLDRPGDVQKVKDFIHEKSMPWRQVHYAGENAVATAYGVEGIPHTVLIDREGKVIRVGLRGEALQKKLAELLK
jgi:thiol-disulfide isomerase/thioredoxin